MDDFKKVFYDFKSRAEQKREPSQIIAKLAYDIYCNSRPDVKNKICLDIGIGSGWAMHSILSCGARHCDGVDISSERITQTNELLANHGFTNFSLKISDAENLCELPSHFYDFVNYLDIIEHLPDYKKGIRELHRVLKNGGLAYIKTPNNYTDNDLKLHHYGQLVCSLFLPGLISEPSGDQVMLRDDISRLTEDERKLLTECVPQDFHEHMHQFYPDELCDLLSGSGFEIVKMSGTPLFSDTLYNNESHLGHFSRVYADFIASGGFNLFINALFEDLKTSRNRPSLNSLPPDYVLSDNLIVIIKKI